MSLLRLCSISRSYQRGHSVVSVLRDASLTVRSGALVAVYGDRSSGKTTLLRIAARFDRPDAGQVAFEGTRGARASRCDVAWVARRGGRSDLETVCDRVALPLYRTCGPRHAHDRARAALETVGAGDCADSRWDDLPDAERTLCATAQALVRGPAILVADDPTAGLGVADRERVGRALRSLAEDVGLGVLIAVPDMSSTLRCHETHLLSRGRLMSARASHPADVIALRPRRSA